MKRGRHRIHGLDLPERVEFSHGAYFYRVKYGRKIRLTRDRSELEEVLRRMGVVPTRMSESHLAVVLTHTRKNARARGIQASLTIEDVKAMWARSGGRCELTHLKFDLTRLAGHRRRPLAPSIDRIDSAGPYTPENCRLVVVAINLAMNEWGESLYRKVALAYLRRKSTPQLEKYAEISVSGPDVSV